MTDDTELSDEVKHFLKKERIKVLKYIDKGSTATVFKAHMGAEKEPKEVAIKFIDLNRLIVKVKEKYIPREISIVERISHQHIIKIHKVLRIDDRFVFIITDFAEGGDLIRVLENNERSLSEDKVRQWFSQIVSAVEYLHSVGIAHRDIKPDNILIQNNIMKLADFGYARVSVDSDGKIMKCRSACGTLEYQSPEAMAGQHPYDPLVSDCFSLGVLLFTMITTYFPFGSGEEIRTKEGRRALILRIANEEWCLSEEHKDNDNLFSVLKQLLNPIPSGRVRSAQILSHPWFRKTVTKN